MVGGSFVTQQIIALLGGGFSTEGRDSPIDRYILSLVQNQRARICFIPTASGDSDNYISRFYTAFKADSFVPSHLALFKRDVVNIEGALLQQDIIYVGGGNTANLLAIWRVHGVDLALRKALDAGVVLAGISAGAMCWFRGGATDSFGGGLNPLDDGLGFISAAFCPHLTSEPARESAFLSFLETIQSVLSNCA